MFHWKNWGEVSVTHAETSAVMKVWQECRWRRKHADESRRLQLRLPVHGTSQRGFWVIFKDGDSVHLCSVDYSASAGTDGPYLDEAELHLHRRTDKPACPTIGELLCGMISCLVLPRDGREEKPPSRLCHLNPTTERNEYILFAYVIFT